MASSVVSVSESWERVESWLAAWAPVTHAALAPPAARSDVAAAAEEAIGMEFPDPLRESLLRHDGTGYRVLPPPFWMLLDTARMVETWRSRTRINERSASFSPDEAEEVDAEADFGPWWHRRWIPFAADGGGDCLVIDQRPSTWRGRVGKADHEQGCFFPRHAMWASLPALLHWTATALETGDVVDGYEPFVTAEGELDWDIP
ncbi:SMI1/KNR4 family protein [Streptomyces sp. 8K308]|nr:SMI1/KNR4 family protein [Streptomyces sp. 8K308]